MKDCYSSKHGDSIDTSANRTPCQRLFNCLFSVNDSGSAEAFNEVLNFTAGIETRAIKKADVARLRWTAGWLQDSI